MPQETLGYVELEWTCKACGSKNKGAQKTCANCGAPMSEKEQFELPAQQALITDEQELKKAELGPDLICEFCSTRNPADAKNCSQCGASLAEAKARQAGQVLGAFQDKPVPDVACPSCGTMNPAVALKCKNCGSSLARPKAETVRPAMPAAPAPKPLLGGRLGVVLGALLLLALCVCGVAFFRLTTSTTTTVAVVQSVAWERVIAIQEQQPVKHSDWEDELPKDAQKLTCQKKVRGTQDQPGPNTEKVCGTPYVVDQGSGRGRVVQDCKYNVMANYCDYTALEWKSIEPIVLRGTDMSPKWPSATLKTSQREGSRSEKYTVNFSGDGSRYTYTTDNYNEFTRFAPNSRWTLEVNGLGGINSLQPAR